MIPQTYTVTSEHIRFYFLLFCFTLQYGYNITILQCKTENYVNKVERKTSQYRQSYLTVRLHIMCLLNYVLKGE